MRALSETAVRGLNALHALMRAGRPMAPRDIAKASQTPREALAGILPKLRAAGLIAGDGRRGYALARAPGEIPLHDVLDALEKPMAPDAPCAGNFEACPSRASCVLAVLCRKAAENYREFLRAFTLEDLRDLRPDLPNCMDPTVRRVRREKRTPPKRRLA